MQDSTFSTLLVILLCTCLLMNMVCQLLHHKCLWRWQKQMIYMIYICKFQTHYVLRLLFILQHIIMIFYVLFISFTCSSNPNREPITRYLSNALFVSAKKATVIDWFMSNNFFQCCIVEKLYFSARSMFMDKTL